MERRQQVMVVGLGQFGMALARALSENGEEVIAIDIREERVQLAAAFAEEALVMDATEEAQLSRLRPGDRDLCVCAIGTESREASIVVTALLRQMGAKHVIARGYDELHERILHLVGAHEVLNPERSFGERLAARLSHRGVLGTMPLGDTLMLTELEAPEAFHGRQLIELKLPNRFEVVVAAVRRRGPHPEGEPTEPRSARDRSGAQVVLPTATTRLQPGDILVLIGPKGAAEALSKEV